jgi:hypothetical protein
LALYENQRAPHKSPYSFTSLCFPFEYAALEHLIALKSIEYYSLKKAIKASFDKLLRNVKRAPMDEATPNAEGPCVNKIPRADPNYEKELAAALFMYMCCEQPVKVRMGGGEVATSLITYIGQEMLANVKANADLKFQLMPAWTVRVDMITDDAQYEDTQFFVDSFLLKNQKLPRMGQK